jgi:hypoxanthine phosphoribosyltransferase
MHNDIARILLDENTIAQRVGELGKAICADLTESARRVKDPSGEPRVVIVPILTGSMVFVADLIRKMPIKLRMEVLGVSSYPGTSVESKGVKMKTALPETLEGAHVLLVDDILDSGNTLDVVTRLVRDLNPASVRTCVLLRKPGKAKVAFAPDYVGFDIPDSFVVGYGLDYDGYYRNLPTIAVLKTLETTS